MFIVRIGLISDEYPGMEVSEELPTANALFAQANLPSCGRGLRPVDYPNIRFSGDDRIELAHYGTKFYVVPVKEVR